MVKEDIFMQIGCLYRKFCEWSGTEGSYDWMDMEKNSEKQVEILRIFL